PHRPKDGLLRHGQHQTSPLSFPSNLFPTRVPPRSSTQDPSRIVRTVSESGSLVSPITKLSTPRFPIPKRENFDFVTSTHAAPETLRHRCRVLIAILDFQLIAVPP